MRSYKKNMMIFMLTALFGSLVFCLPGSMEVYFPAGADKALFSSRNLLRLMFACLMAALAACFACRLVAVKKGEEEMKNQLEQLQYMLQMERMLFDAHIKPEGMRNALRRVGEALTAQKAFLLIMKGRTVIRYYLWDISEQEVEDKALMKDCEFFADYFVPDEGSIVANGREHLEKKYPGIETMLVRRNIRNLMLTPVSSADGERMGILGVSNMERTFKDAKLLECVALSFLKAINNIQVYERTMKMGMMDGLTGLYNRNSYYTAISDIEKNRYQSLACIYLDVNGLHEVNNHLGHDEGDKMLRFIADEMKIHFGSSDTYRIGGDEFVAICRDLPVDEVLKRVEAVKKSTAQAEYYVSVGVEWQDSDFNINAMVKSAEEKMLRDKRIFYEKKEDVRRMRQMNLELEKMLSEKQDADAFLSVIAPEFKGVYFVNLTRDTVRHIFIPSYFEVMLDQTNGKFSDAMLLYASEIVKAEYRESFKQFTDYKYVEECMEGGEVPELIYQKMDESWVRFRILKFKKYSQGDKETLWIFEETKTEEQE